MQDTGVHVVGMTAEDALPQIFRGKNCMEQFLQWLEQLTEQDTCYVTALAHNFKGCDSYFVVKRLIKRKQKFKPTRTGGKLLELTYIRGVHSLHRLHVVLRHGSGFVYQNVWVGSRQFQEGGFSTSFQHPCER